MADDTSNTDQGQQTGQQQSTNDQQQSSDENLGDAGKRALEAERTARKNAEKEIRDLKKAQQDAELAGKPEAERTAAALKQATDALNAANAQAEEAARELARYKAAAKYGLTEEDVEFLTGDADEIDSRAKKLADRLGQAGQPRKPRPDPTQGASGGKPSGDAAADFADFMNQQLNRRA